MLDAAREMFIRAHQLESTDGQAKEIIIADLRARSISTAYYAAFAAMRIIVADRVVPVRQSDEAEAAWSSVYRGISHTSLQEATKLLNRRPSRKWKTLGTALTLIADLRTWREKSDYDPDWFATATDAGVALLVSETAIRSIEALHKEADSLSLLVAATLIKARR